MLSRLLPVLLLALGLFEPSVSARKISKNDIRTRQHEAAQQFHARNLIERKSEGVQNITFSNPRASGELRDSVHGVYTRLTLGAEFWVNGSAIPEVDWDVGPSWSGLLPISGNANETRKVGNSQFPLQKVAYDSILSSSSSGSSLLAPEETSNLSPFGTTAVRDAAVWKVYCKRTA